jgi:hypothetical protein
LLAAIVVGVGVAYALSSVTVQQPGHIRIVNNGNAGLSITPAVLEFGNVTIGQAVNQTITAKNTGTCWEILGLSGSSNNVTLPNLLPQPRLAPGQSETFFASYSANQTANLPPGDYRFLFTWTATCF